MFRTSSAIAGLLALVSASQAAVLENPGRNRLYSGIGVISGWKCEVQGASTVRFNGGNPLPLAYLNERADTASVCGDTDNGFVSIMNWAELGDGTHTAVVYDNDVEFTRSTFEGRTAGEAVLGREVQGQVWMYDFPSPGERTRFVWNANTQHLELAEVRGQPRIEEQTELSQIDKQLLLAVRSDAPLSEIRRLIAAGANVNARNEGGETPLYWVIQHENLDGVRVLLNVGADANTRNENGQPLLYWVIGPGGDNSEPEIIRQIVQLLINAGADVDAGDKLGQTPLYSATFRDEHSARVQLLLDAGANVNARTNDGWTPLHLAAQRNRNPEIIQLLLDAGADVNASNENGQTPLYIAVGDSGGFLEIVRVLLDAGADVNARTKDGWTPLDVAIISNKDPEIIQLLRNAGAKRGHEI